MFLGVVRFEGRQVDRREEERLAAILSKRVRRPPVRRFSHGVVIGGDPGDPTSDGFASLSELDNLSEIAARLGAGASIRESACIQASFERRGDAGIAGLGGSFVFAHWDEPSRTLSLARDLFGHRFSLFYHRGDGFVAFATHLSDLLAMPDVPRALDERLMANFLALNHREVEATPYRGISRVPSRGVVRITPAGQTFARYWSPRVAEPPPYRRPEDYVAHGRELFDKAIARAVRDVPRAAIQLSGGFDSSAIAATIMRLGGVDLSGFTGVPPKDLNRPPAPGLYLDETDKIQALSARYPGLDVNFVTPRADGAAAVDPQRAFFDVPLAVRNVGNLGWFSQIDDAIQAQGHTIVFHGGLGNVTMSWMGRPSWPSPLRQLRHLAGRTVRRWGGESSSRPSTDGFDEVGKFSLINPRTVEELGLKSQWQADGFDPTYRIPRNSAEMRAHQIFDQLQLSRDMMAMRQATKGISYRDPYADRELIEFCLSVPDEIFCRNRERRWFARRVFADRLPPEILTERRRGEQAPNWFEALDARRPIMLAEVERMESSTLASRLLDIPRMKRLLEDWPQNAEEAQLRSRELRLGLDRAVHVGQFVRWVEGGNG